MNEKHAFLPTTAEEVKARGWDALDVILISGDTYIDSSYMGVAVIGRYLLSKGYRVGIIAQPNVEVGSDITRLGEPRLYWGVSGGSVDSMVANYTALKKRRKSCDMTPGGQNTRRPDRASLVYSNLIRRFYKNTRPIVLGGIEASLRRVVHYDYWTDKLRRSLILDAKADYLVYGMGEKTALEITDALRDGRDVTAIRGLFYIAKEAPTDYLELPDWDSVCANKAKFTEMFNKFYLHSDPITAKGLYQRYGDRIVVQNPPQQWLSSEELDEIHDLPYTRDVHPYYGKAKEVRALETLRFSINTHRGCYGGCNFCAIAVHQGRTVISRSEGSIEAEAEAFIRDKAFKGIISDVGGPTANMYGFECEKKLNHGCCKKKQCIFPTQCNKLEPDHSSQIRLLRKLRKKPGIRKVFVASGLRYDLIMNDTFQGDTYLQELTRHHVSGQLKVAPEHACDHILSLMGKPGMDSVYSFRERFNQISEESGKQQFLTYYFIAAHPGCSEDDMRQLKRTASEKLSLNPEQVQIFTPTPSTYSTLMYYTETNPFNGEPIFVEKFLHGKARQKMILTEKGSAGQRHRPPNPSFL